jgi:phenylacetate-CoA ligase
MDEVCVRVELDPNFLSDKMNEMTQLQRRIERSVQQLTGLSMTVELLPPFTLERFEGKAKRVQDNRKLV